MSKVTGFISRLPEWFIFIIGIIGVLIIGYIDYFTGDYSLIIFYICPIALVSWFASCLGGVLVAVLSGCARFIADYSAVTDVRLLYWNSTEDTLFLVVVAVLIFFLRKALNSHQDA